MSDPIFRRFRLKLALFVIFVAAVFARSFRSTKDVLDYYREAFDVSRQHAAQPISRPLISSPPPAVGAPEVFSGNGQNDSQPISRHLIPSPTPAVGASVHKIEVSSTKFDHTIITPEDTCFVHIGKTAGSRIGCLLGMPYVGSCQRDSEVWQEHVEFRQSNVTQTPNYFSPNPHYMHMGKYACKIRPDVVLVTTRNPLLRLHSDFYFESKPEAPRDKLTGAPLYRDCYSDFEDMVNEGLGHDISRDENISASVWNMTCPQRAWAFATGARAFQYHAWYNYEYYYTTLKLRSRNSHVFVIRQEFLHKDWVQVDRMFGGNGTSLDALLGVKINSNSEKAAMGKSVQQLCRALCLEIQHYKRILEAAVNLDPNDLEESMQELRTYCPDETSSVRVCPNMPAFPAALPGDKFIRRGKRRFSVARNGKQSIS